MSYQKTFVCLAASYRPGGACVAGKEYKNGKFGDWIRPIGHPSSEKGQNNEDAISDVERLNNRKQLTDVLDVVNIQFDGSSRSGDANRHQSENRLISDGSSWQLIERINALQLCQALDSHEKSLWNNNGSTSLGQNDVVSTVELSKIRNSLLLIHVDQLELKVFNQEYDGKKKWRGKFDFCCVPYNLSMTDIGVRQKYRTLGSYYLENVIMCISLAEFKGKAYKLIASVITSDLT